VWGLQVLDLGFKVQVSGVHGVKGEEGGRFVALKVFFEQLGFRVRFGVFFFFFITLKPRVE